MTRRVRSATQVGHPHVLEEIAVTAEASALPCFDSQFELLTGNPPFPWQRMLYERLVSDRADNIPAACDIPTGLGKTSVITIWLIARINRPSRVPRRLVYVVNRRTVVDQATVEAEKLRESLPRLNATLGELAISTLRGQFADNREWSADPSRTAIICGTVDMIGSRLLFCGYGTGFRSRPLHAGFLGQDVLLVHDEAHLEPAFQSLLLSIQDEQRRCKEFHPIRIMELSATPRSRGEVLRLTPADEANEVVKRRLRAKKALTFYSVDDENRKLADKLLELALAHGDSGQAILVFVRTIDDLGKISAGLPEDRLRQLTGTMRGLERETLVRDPVFCRFLSESNRPKDVVLADATVYLVCTSAGEVGVNISADHLVCDLSTFDSMIQRFGRVNRFGLRTDDARIDVVHPVVFKDDKSDIARKRTLALLQSLRGNASVSTLSSLMQSLSDADRKAAFAPEPELLHVTEILFDAWALTTIRDKLPGRPPVFQYLHGVSEWEPPQTFVAWRREVWELRRTFGSESERREFQKYAAELLDGYPLKTHELLRDRASRVLAALKRLAASPETPIWILEDARVSVTTLGSLVDGGARMLDDKTVLLPPQAGGLKFYEKGGCAGLLDASQNHIPERQGSYDVADEWFDHKNVRLRRRQWNDNVRPARMKLECAIVLEDSEDDSEGQARTWYWFVRYEAAEPDARGIRSYPLQRHLDDAREEAGKLASNLSLNADIRDAVIFAAATHDLGKDREGWQREIGNFDYPAQVWAKSGERRAAAARSYYRHEFGSVLDAQALPEFGGLSCASKELALHLIAAHHARARPHFAPEEMLDDNDPDKVRLLASEVPLRYARLQRRYGRWGLAYLESLVRSVDYVVSEKAFRTGDVAK